MTGLGLSRRAPWGSHRTPSQGGSQLCSSQAGGDCSLPPRGVPRGAQGPMGLNEECYGQLTITASCRWTAK